MGRAPEEKVDPISVALALAALTCTGVMLLTKPTLEKRVAMSVSLLSWVSYDRWHDGMWPFTDIERQRQAEML